MVMIIIRNDGGGIHDNARPVSRRSLPGLQPKAADQRQWISRIGVVCQVVKRGCGKR